MYTRSYLARAVLFGLLTSIALPAAAQGPPTTELRALKAIVFANPNETKYDENWRHSVAGALAAWCDDLKRRTPRNTPAEDRWVDAEFADAVSLDDGLGNDNKRMERLENSVEYARQQLSNAFSACASSAKSILVAQKSRRDEALLWIELVRFLASSADIQREAVIVGLLPRNFSPLNNLTLSHDFKYDDEIGLATLANPLQFILMHALNPLVKGE